MVLVSGVGRVRISLNDQRFILDLLESPDSDRFFVDVGDIIGDQKVRADVFVAPGYIDARPVLYWRETYQHRSFRQGILTIDPESVSADWNRVLVPLCEGRGGVDVSH